MTINNPFVIGGTQRSGTSYTTRVLREHIDGRIMGEPILGAADPRLFGYNLTTREHPWFPQSVVEDVRDAFSSVVMFCGWLPSPLRRRFQASIRNAYESSPDNVVGLKEVRHSVYVADALGAKLLYLYRDCYARALSVTARWLRLHGIPPWSMLYTQAYLTSCRPFAESCDVWSILTKGTQDSFASMVAWFLIETKADMWLIDKLGVDALVVPYDAWQDAPSYYSPIIGEFLDIELPDELYQRGFTGNPKAGRNNAKHCTSLNRYNLVQRIKRRADNLNWEQIFDENKEVREREMI